MTADYRIDRTDIRGVGPTVRDHLDPIDIESVAALHLLARRGGRSWRQLEERGVGKDTLEHLQAALTPELASKYPELATEFPVRDWVCPSCTTTYAWDAIEGTDTTINLPLCPQCADADDLVELTTQEHEYALELAHTSIGSSCLLAKNHSTLSG